MEQVEIRATFGHPDAAQEAYNKLQALRAFDVSGMPDSGMLTATVDVGVADRAMHLIRQIGGDIV